MIKHSEYIIGVSLPTLHEVYLKRIEKKSNTILKDQEHPANKYMNCYQVAKGTDILKAIKDTLTALFHKQ